MKRNLGIGIEPELGHEIREESSGSESVPNTARAIARRTKSPFVPDVHNCAGTEHYSPLASGRLAGVINELREPDYISSELGKRWQDVKSIPGGRLKYADIVPSEYFRRPILRPADVLRRVAVGRQ